MHLSPTVSVSGSSRIQHRTFGIFDVKLKATDAQASVAYITDLGQLISRHQVWLMGPDGQFAMPMHHPTDTTAALP
jgi:hypothetical protein